MGACDQEGKIQQVFLALVLQGGDQEAVNLVCFFILWACIQQQVALLMATLLAGKDLS